MNRAHDLFIVVLPVRGLASEEREKKKMWGGDTFFVFAPGLAPKPARNANKFKNNRAAPGDLLGRDAPARPRRHPPHTYTRAFSTQHQPARHHPDRDAPSKPPRVPARARTAPPHPRQGSPRGPESGTGVRDRPHRPSTARVDRLPVDLSPANAGISHPPPPHRHTQNV